MASFRGLLGYKPVGETLWLAVEPAAGQVHSHDPVLIFQLLEEIPDGPVQHRVFDVGRQLGEWLEDEAPLVHQEVGDVQVVRSTDHQVSIEQDVDVERARLVPLILRRARPAAPAELLLDLLDTHEQGHRVERRLDGYRAIEEPGVLVGLLTGPLLPGLRPVERRGVEELDPRHGPELGDRPAQALEPITQIGAHREKYPGHVLFPDSSRENLSRARRVPPSTPGGGVRPAWPPGEALWRHPAGR